MKVTPNQNPTIPVQGSEIADVIDGTSNTKQVGERTKSEKPFAEDSFESYQTSAQRIILGEIASAAGSEQYNPKEVNVDKSVPWQKSQRPSASAKEVETTSTKENIISYNGHAGLGENK
ncbi:hypothetical protein L0156_25940 [bacterium]|nr:hypothetical protein [bacterium]